MSDFKYKCTVLKNGSKRYYKNTDDKWKRITNKLGKNAERGKRKYMGPNDFLRGSSVVKKQYDTDKALYTVYDNKEEIYIDEIFIMVLKAVSPETYNVCMKSDNINRCGNTRTFFEKTLQKIFSFKDGFQCYTHVMNSNNSADDVQKFITNRLYKNIDCGERVNNTKGVTCFNRLGINNSGFYITFSLYGNGKPGNSDYNPGHAFILYFSSKDEFKYGKEGTTLTGEYNWEIKLYHSYYNYNGPNTGFKPRIEILKNEIRFQGKRYDTYYFNSSEVQFFIINFVRSIQEMITRNNNNDIYLTNSQITSIDTLIGGTGTGKNLGFKNARSKKSNKILKFSSGKITLGIITRRNASYNKSNFINSLIEILFQNKNTNQKQKWIDEKLYNENDKKIYENYQLFENVINSDEEYNCNYLLKEFKEQYDLENDIQLNNIQKQEMLSKPYITNRLEYLQLQYNKEQQRKEQQRKEQQRKEQQRKEQQRKEQQDVHMEVDTEKQ